MRFPFIPTRFLPQKPVNILQRRTSKRNAQLLLNLIIIFIILIILYSILFHVIMILEGGNYSFITGFYWTMTTMTTLGLGDIAFQTDTGKIFTVVVLLTGILFLLVIIPFIIVQLFQSSARAPRELPVNIKNHVILTGNGALTQALINKLNFYRIPYILIIASLSEALDLIDTGFRVVLGDLDDPETYHKAQANQAALIATSNDDPVNTTVTFAVRSVAENVPVIATAHSPGSAEVLQIAGCNHILALDQILGESMARRVTGNDALAHVIGNFNDIFIAEATCAGTPLVGKSLRDVKLREIAGPTVIGTWQHGIFNIVTPDTILTPQTVLVIAGSREQIENYNAMFCIYNAVSKPVLIIGGGSVGTTMSEALSKRNVDFRIIEKIPDRYKDRPNYFIGDARHKENLVNAGILEAPAVAITTHDDDLNLYLTTLCRHLNPQIQIISRATTERIIPLLHKSGSDFVLSYASIGANSIFNYLQSGNILMIAEGVDVFKIKLPKSLSGVMISDSGIREKTGCSIIAILDQQEIEINPSPQRTLKESMEIILIGNASAEAEFFKKYV